MIKTTVGGELFLPPPVYPLPRINELFVTKAADKKTEVKKPEAKKSESKKPAVKEQPKKK